MLQFIYTTVFRVKPWYKWYYIIQGNIQSECSNVYLEMSFFSKDLSKNNFTKRFLLPPYTVKIEALLVMSPLFNQQVEVTNTDFNFQN